MHLTFISTYTCDSEISLPVVNILKRLHYEKKYTCTCTVYTLLLICLAAILCCSLSTLDIRGRSAVADTVLARISGKGSNVTGLTSEVSAAVLWAEKMENP